MNYIWSRIWVQKSVWKINFFQLLSYSTGFYLFMFVLPHNQGTRLLAEEMLSKYPADQWVSDFRLHGLHHGPAAELTFSSFSLVIQPLVHLSHYSVSWRAECHEQNSPEWSIKKLSRLHSRGSLTRKRSDFWVFELKFVWMFLLHRMAN